MSRAKIIFLFLLVGFLSCREQEPDPKGLLLNQPLDEPEPFFKKLNPELSFYRIKLGNQVRRAIAYAPGQELIIPKLNGKIKFSFGVIPQYFLKHQQAFELQLIDQSLSPEKIIWTETISKEMAGKWHYVEITLSKPSERIIFRSDIKDFGLVITPPIIFTKTSPAQPTIIFILVDALRADHLGAYGYSRNTSPNLDELARSGTIFLNAITASPFTVSSLTSMFTGLYPWEHKAVFAYSLILRPDLITLAQKLRENGYFTAGFSATYFHLSDFSLDRGFELFDETCSEKFFFGDAECLNQAVSNWLEAEARAPFFLFIHYVSPHAPYHPPLEYQNFFNTGLEKPKGEIGEGDVQRFTSNRRFYQIPRAPTEKELKWLISQYDAEIRYVDEQIGRLVKELYAQKGNQPLLVLITADHGEAFYEHKEVEHRTELHWQVLHIPLIIFGDQIPSGEQIKSLVRSVDIAPSLMEYAKVSPFINISGKSFLGLIQGENEPERIGWAINFKNKKRFQISLVMPPYQMLVWKPKNKKIELYNFWDDPEEKNNLALENVELVQNLLKLFPSYEQILSGEKPPQVKYDSETRKRLKSLHYLK